MHSKNSAVATYAAAALFNINKDKPADYASRLDLQISAALCRDDVSDLHSLPDDPAYSDMLYNHATYDPTASIDHPAFRPAPRNGHTPGWFDTDL